MTQVEGEGDGQRVQMDVGDPVLMDSVGARVILTEPAGDVALLLDLEGKLNKLQERVAHRFLMPVGMAAELIAELLVTAQHAAVEEHERVQPFLAELEDRIVEGQRQRGMIG
jgi:hypothetical protein